MTVCSDCKRAVKNEDNILVGDFCEYFPCYGCPADDYECPCDVMDNDIVYCNMWEARKDL